ncbi:hypothetical protein PAEPH01_2686 [Pancytospora epiphaga]|nr:hypothetical protein PAEPH01_2686 [Pancytospora epiphaga]
MMQNKKMFRNLRSALQLNDEQLDKDDLKSVEKRVEKKNPEDGIRYYSGPDSSGSKFVLGTKINFSRPIQNFQ